MQFKYLTSTFPLTPIQIPKHVLRITLSKPLLENAASKGRSEHSLKASRIRQPGLRGPIF